MNFKAYIYGMKWLVRTMIFIGLSLVLLFALNANESAGDSIEVEKSASNFSPDSIHTSLFLQPQVSRILILQQKASTYSLVKYVESFLATVSDFKIKIPFLRFANQDINRCEMVSLLLFPFHSFW